jgi:hypothetical protein
VALSMVSPIVDLLFRTCSFPRRTERGASNLTTQLRMSHRGREAKEWAWAAWAVAGIEQVVMLLPGPLLFMKPAENSQAPARAVH